MKKCLIGFIILTTLIFLNGITKVSAYTNYYDDYSWYNEEFIYNKITELGYNLEDYPYVATLVNTTMTMYNATIYLFTSDLHYYRTVSGSAGSTMYTSSSIIEIEFGRGTFTSNGLVSNPRITVSNYTSDTLQPILYQKDGSYNTNFDLVDKNGTVLQSANLDFSDLTGNNYFDFLEIPTVSNGINALQINAVIHEYTNIFTYQYSINDGAWLTVNEEDLFNFENYGDEVEFRHIARYNQKFSFRVLNSINEVIEEKSIIVNSLEDFNMKISSNEANDLQNRNIMVYMVDLRNCYSDSYKYQYSYDNINFYDIDIPSDKIFYLNHALPIKVYFRIVDSSNTVIYTKEANDYYDSIKKEIIIKESFNNDTEKQIIIDFDFSDYARFNDIYNMTFYVDNELLSTSTKTIVLTKKNYKSAIDLRVFVDELEIYDLYRVGQIGSGGGSDTTFDENYDNIVNDTLENEINSDFSTTENMIDSVLKFINAIKSFIVIFFELIMRFFNNLNVWIRTCIIALFIELVICRIIKAVRK